MGSDCEYATENCLWNDEFMFHYVRAVASTGSPSRLFPISRTRKHSSFSAYSPYPLSQNSRSFRTETGPVADMSLFRSEILSGSSQNRQGHLQCSKGRAGPWTNFSNVFDFCGKSLELTGDV